MTADIWRKLFVLTALLWVGMGTALYSARPGEVDRVGLAKLPPPYFEPDSALCTWGEAHRVFKFILLPEYRQFWNCFYGADSPNAPDLDDYIRDKYVDIPSERIKLISLGLEIPTLEEYRLVDAFLIRLYKCLFVDRDTKHVVLSGPVPQISPELAQSVDEDLAWINSVIDCFLADGYTPENIMRRLWDENVYLNFSVTFLKLFYGTFYCWPLTAMYYMAQLRISQSDEYLDALKIPSRVSWPFVDLGDNVDFKTYAAKLNMSEAMLYCGLIGSRMPVMFPSIRTIGGKICGSEPLPNPLRSAHLISADEYEMIFQYPVCYLDQHGVKTWIGEASDWKDLKSGY